jgi:hypothetical protein
MNGRPESLNLSQSRLEGTTLPVSLLKLIPATTKHCRRICSTSAFHGRDFLRIASRAAESRLLVSVVLACNSTCPD